MAGTPRKTVLVVDDESLIRWALAQGLREHFEVVTAASADEASYILARQRVDAVVTDLHMPGLEGVEFVDYLVRHHPEAKLFVISAYASEPVARHLSRSGVLESLGKPFEMEDVIAMLERHLGPQRAAEERPAQSA